MSNWLHLMWVGHLNDTKIDPLKKWVSLNGAIPPQRVDSHQFNFPVYWIRIWMVCSLLVAIQIGRLLPLFEDLEMNQWNSDFGSLPAYVLSFVI